MALASGTIFAVQATATTGNVNGAGFNPANTHMLTDLATDANTANTSSPIVSSATYNFASGDAGNWVYIKSGTHWQAGWYKIASVSAPKATLSAGIGAAILTISAQGLITTNATAGCTSDNTATLSAGTFTIDYSQTDTAVVNAVTTGTQTAASTTFTDTTANPFTPVMVGNLIHLTAVTGTGALVGWYEVVQYTDAGDIVLDRTATNGVNNITAATYHVGGAGRLNGLEDTFQAMLPAAATVFVKNGTYTLSAAISTASTNGTGANPVF